MSAPKDTKTVLPEKNFDCPRCGADPRNCVCETYDEADDDEDEDDGAMTLATFKASKTRVDWSEAPDEALQTYEDPEETSPTHLLVYAGGVWIAELPSTKLFLAPLFELHLEREDYRSATLHDLEVILFEWAVRECDLREDDASPEGSR